MDGEGVRAAAHPLMPPPARNNLGNPQRATCRPPCFRAALVILEHRNRASKCYYEHVRA